MDVDSDSQRETIGRWKWTGDGSWLLVVAVSSKNNRTSRSGWLVDFPISPDTAPPQQPALVLES